MKKIVLFSILFAVLLLNHNHVPLMLSPQPGYISNDDPARVSYISSQYPLQPELYILVRQACIRSLSCEVRIFYL